MNNLKRIVIYTACTLMCIAVWFLPIHWILKVIPDLFLLNIMFVVYCVDTAHEYPDDEPKIL